MVAIYVIWDLMLRLSTGSVPGARARPLGDSQSKTGWDSGTLTKNAAYSTASLSRYLNTQDTRQSSGSQASGANNKGIIEMRQSDVQIRSAACRERKLSDGRFLRH